MIKKILSVMILAAVFTSTAYADFSLPQPVTYTQAPEDKPVGSGDFLLEYTTSYAPSASFSISNNSAVGEGDTIEELTAYMRKCVQERQPVIDISNFSIKVIEARQRLFYASFLFSNCDLPLYASWGISLDENGYVKSFTPSYIFSSSEKDEEYAEDLDLFITEIADVARNADNDLEKVLLVYDEISDRFYYTPQPEGGYTQYHRVPLTFMENGHGICQGFAMIYKLVLDKLGIDNLICMSDSAVHSWNYIRIDDNWYHSDVTNGGSSAVNNYVNHSYFLLSDNTIEESYGDFYKDLEDVIPLSHYIAAVECVSDKFEDMHAFNMFNSHFTKPDDNFFFKVAIKAQGSNNTTISNVYDFEISELPSKGFFFSQPKDGIIHLLNATNHPTPLRLIFPTYNSQGGYIGARMTKALTFSGNMLLPLPVSEMAIDTSSLNRVKYMLINLSTLEPMAYYSEYVFE